ncbi:MAG: hypothetical protein KIT46_04515 [Anaerolineales bacterium]|nr:hypothetical protein [Anaerolineales bacterium]MCW5855293.1 hypothetical protein [Anaerolineales bacterium]
MTEIHIRIEGGPEVQAMLRALPPQLERSAEAAGKEFAGVVLEQDGVLAYPPTGPGSQPPAPYYQRGVGMQYSNGYNDLRSERYGASFSVSARGYRTEVGNAASYAEHLGGVKQARHMAALGWRRLIDAARSKLGEGRRIYVRWIEHGLQRLGLK